jgi:hypothetical protein
MPVYRIKQREIHDSIFDVEADNIADALEKVQDGEAAVVDSDFVEVDERNGISLSKLSPEDANLIRDRGLVSGWTTHLLGIQQIKKV